MDHVNVILLGKKPLALLDSAYAETADDLTGWLRKTAPDGLDMLILTHFHRDHMGGAAAVCKATGAKVYAHPIEIPLMHERQPSLDIERIEAGSKFRFERMEIEALLTPGHSPGHLSFWWAEERVLFGGDNVLLPTTTSIQPPFGRLIDYQRTLERLLALDPRIIYPGHGSPILAPAKRIRALLQHRTRRGAQVLERLSDGLNTPGAIAQNIYPDLDERRLAMAINMVHAQLQKLMEEGKVEEEDGRYRFVGEMAP